MDEKVAFLVRSLQSSFPDASITDTLLAVNSLLTRSSLGSPLPPLSAHQQHQQRTNGSENGVAAGGEAKKEEAAWRRDVAAVIDLAASAQGATRVSSCVGHSPPKLGLAQRLEAAALEWQRTTSVEGNGRQGSLLIAAAAATNSPVLTSPLDSSHGPSYRSSPGNNHGIVRGGEFRVTAAAVGGGGGGGGVSNSYSVPSSRRDSVAAAGTTATAAVVAMTSGGTNNFSFDATPSMVSIDATPEELPVGSPGLMSGSEGGSPRSPSANHNPHPPFHPDGSNGADSGEAHASQSTQKNSSLGAAQATRETISVPVPLPPALSHGLAAVTASASAGEVAETPLALTGDERANSAEVHLSAEKSARLAEELCRGVYENLYQQFVTAANELEGNDDEGEEEDLPAPLCSLVIECDGAGGHIVPTLASPHHGAEHAEQQRYSAAGSGSNSGRVFSFVVGCSWAQWEYMRRGPLACRCPPYPPPDAPWAEKLQWRQRHCQIRFLHPLSDFLQQRQLGSPASTGNGDAGSGGSSCHHNPDETASDVTTTNVEYDLSEGHVVLRSLLGLAMRVWSEEDAHLVAQIDDLEASQATRTYHSDVFWANFPQTVPPPVRRGDRASLRGCRLPTPLLPGEYADAEVDEGEEEEVNGG